MTLGMAVPSERRGSEGASPEPRSKGLERDDFEALYQENYGVLWCVAAAILGRRSDADDCVQEAAMTAWSQRDRFEPGTNFGAWMSQIVRFTALNMRRRRHRRDATWIGPGAEGGVEPPTSERREQDRPVTGAGQLAPGQDSFDDEIFRALSGLEETARICLLLRVVLELPYRAIALQLGIPEGTAMSHVHRSRKAVREALMREGQDQGG